MTDDQKREIVERVAREEYETQVARVLDTRIGPHPKWENLSFESRQSRMWLTECYLQVANHFELIDLLLDCWVQFALRDDNGGRFHGSLSILEDLESMLSDLGLIDTNGLLESERAALKGGEGE